MKKLTPNPVNRIFNYTFFYRIALCTDLWLTVRDRLLQFLTDPNQTGLAHPETISCHLKYIKGGPH